MVILILFHQTLLLPSCTPPPSGPLPRAFSLLRTLSHPHALSFSPSEPSVYVLPSLTLSSHNSSPRYSLDVYKAQVVKDMGAIGM